jgi:hypothetical protein
MSRAGSSVAYGNDCLWGTKIATVINPYDEEIETVRMPADGYIWAWTIIGPDNPNWCVQAGSPVAYLFSEK